MPKLSNQLCATFTQALNDAQPGLSEFLESDGPEFRTDYRRRIFGTVGRGRAVVISDAPMAKDAIIQAPSKGDDSSLPLHERIRTACGQRSIQEIARGIGTNPETTRRYLRGICRPTPEFLAGVCDFANVSAQWLLLGIGPRSLTEAATETLKRTSTQALVAELVERVSDNSTAVNDIDAAIVQILRQCFPDGRQVGSNRSSSGGETLVCSNSHHKSKK